MSNTQGELENFEIILNCCTKLLDFLIIVKM